MNNIISTAVKANNELDYKSSKKCEFVKIEPVNLEMDMTFKYTKGILSLGTITDNYWFGSCAVYDRAFTFKIFHAEQIKEFNLFKVGFDDYMQITFNDHIVYIGPDGGSKLEVIEIKQENKVGSLKLVNNGICHSSCERGTSWQQQPNIDLKPYIHEGENTIKMKVIVGGTGEGWLQIHLAQEYCNNDNYEYETIEIHEHKTIENNENEALKMSGEECDFS